MLKSKQFVQQNQYWVREVRPWRGLQFLATQLLQTYSLPLFVLAKKMLVKTIVR